MVKELVNTFKTPITITQSFNGIPTLEPVWELNAADNTFPVDGRTHVMFGSMWLDQTIGGTTLNLAIRSTVIHNRITFSETQTEAPSAPDRRDEQTGFNETLIVVAVYPTIRQTYEAAHPPLT